MSGNVGAALPGADEAQRKRIVRWHAEGHDELDCRGVPRFASEPDANGRLIELTIKDRIVLARDGWPEDDAPESDKPRRTYGCARRGCDAVNPDYLSYGAYGKSWCLHHAPLRIRIRRWFGADR